MRSLVLAAGLASTLLLGASVARAQPVRACPDGQAIQSFDASGRSIGCIAVPPAESGLSGRYAVVGTGLCTRATAGFRSDLEFVPNVAPNAMIQPQSFTYRGIRTFADGTAHGASTVYSISYPALVVGGAFINTGGGSVAEFEQDWTYELGPDRTLTITGQGSHGTAIQGGSAVGATLSTVGAPPLTGQISKDWRTIVLTNASMAVEHVIQTTPSGVTTDLPRICTRTETLTKIAD